MDARGAPITGDDRWTDPRWEYPEYPNGSVIEIRVHGVGGEAPSGMTRDQHPRLVGGDQLAGFWRARNPVIRPLTGAENGPLHVREVLSWGGQTSGTFRHAFWVLLLPFALMNFAGRMYPHDADSPRARGYRAVARVLAYTVTLTVISLWCGLAFDLLGAQCGSDPDCLMGPTTDGAAGSGSVIFAPVRYFDAVGRMGLLALLPVAALLGLWWAGKYHTRELEGRREGAGAAAEGEPPREPTQIRDPWFWRNEWPTWRLRSIHAIGVFAFIGATLCLALMDFAPTSQQAWWWWLGVAPSVAVIVVCGALAARSATILPGPDSGLHHTLWLLRLIALAPLVVAFVLALYGHAAEGGWQGFPAWGSEWPPAAQAALVAAAAIAGADLLRRWVRDSVAARSSDRPGTGLASNLVLVAGLALIGVALAATGAIELRATASIPVDALPPSFAWMGEWIGDRLILLHRGVHMPAYVLLVPLAGAWILLLIALAGLGADRSVPQRPGRGPLAAPAVWANLGGVVVALLALLVVSAAGASVHALALDWLGTRVRAGVAAPEGQTGLGLPWGYAYTAVVTTLVLPLILGAVFLVRRRRAGGKLPEPDAGTVADHVGRGFASGPVPDADGSLGEADRERLHRIGKRWRTEYLIRDAGPTLAWGILIVVALIIASFILVAVSDEITLADDLPFVTTLAVWATTGIVIGAVGVMRSALREEGTRRDVGKLWDVVTFWPRVTHPFAPPCYAEAIVPMLNDRTRRLLDAPREYKVLIAGHSQGSVVALTSVVAADLPADSRSRLALATYGSPIAILYERFFPGVFAASDGPMQRAEERVASWHHFFAMTEPFALPFWAVGAGDDGTAGQAPGWPAHLLVTHADTPCPVCGWSAPEIGEPSGAARADVIVTDPDRWTQPLDSVPPAPAGHSTYHHHREVDEHLCHIAAQLGDRADAS